MIMPYLSFDGNCEEALTWYAEIFGAKALHVTKYADIPESAGIPVDPEQRDKVMHAQLMLTESGGLSGADVLWPVEKGGAVSIHAHVEGEEKARMIFAALAESGEIVGDLAVNPPPDDDGLSGCVKDRYGFTWIISAMKAIA